MQGFLIVFAGTGILVVYVTVKTAHQRLTHHGAAVGVARYLSGTHWSGNQQTNATFFKAATGSHSARNFHHRPGWQRLLRRSGPIFGVIFAGIGYEVNPVATIVGLALATIAGAVLAAWSIRRKLQRRRHRLAWILPTHLALAERAGYSLNDRPERWLEVEPDRSRAKLMLPVGCNFDEREKAAIVSTAASKLALENPTANWTLHGQTPSLILKASKPAPPKVSFAEVVPAIEQAAEDELVLGIGKENQLVKVSLSGDSPHVALSMGSGAGKSVLASSILAQHLHGGGIALVTDPKLISLNWARQLPNAAYAGTPEEIHRAFVWAGREIERRNAVALASADVNGVIHGNVGPRLLVVAEELNVTMARLRSYWQSTGEKGRSPAIEMFETILFAGRQVKVHLVGIAQMLTHTTAGSGAGRENFGTRIMGRYTGNNWKVMAGDVAMPPSSRTPGRVQVLTSGVKETQTPFVKPAEARAFALSGTVTPCPASMPFRGVSGPVHDAVEAAPDLGSVPSIEAPSHGLVTIRQAVEAGVLKGSITAIRKARHRGNGFPEHVAEHDGAFWYEPSALAAWAERKAS